MTAALVALAAATFAYAERALAQASVDDAAVARAACQEALARGNRIDATAACRRAQMFGPTAEDMRYTVAAMVNGTPPPSLDDLALATLTAEGATRLASTQPWGYAARCDIARRMRVPELQRACVADLQRLAPDHAETKRALALAEPRPRAVIGRLAALALIPLLLLVTLVHAVAGRRRRAQPAPAGAGSAGGEGGAPHVTTTAAALVLVIGALLAAPRAAHAGKSPFHGENLSSIPIDDAHPERAVPPVAEQNRNPIELGYLIQDFAFHAEKAIKQGDHATAARYYYALTVAAPNRAYPWRKLCEERELTGDHAGALSACREALNGLGVELADFTNEVKMVLAKPAQLTPADLQDLDAVITHLQTQKGVGPTVVPRLRCEIALHDHDVAGLQACTTDLAKAAPDDAATISFQWALAAEKRDRAQALVAIEHGRKAGMPADAIAHMVSATDALWKRWTPLRIGLVVAGAVLLTAAVFVVALRRGRGARPHLTA